MKNVIERLKNELKSTLDGRATHQRQIEELLKRVQHEREAILATDHLAAEIGDAIAALEKAHGR